MRGNAIIKLVPVRHFGEAMYFEPPVLLKRGGYSMLTI